jgi:hypothetical protein
MTTQNLEQADVNACLASEHSPIANERIDRIAVSR